MGPTKSVAAKIAFRVHKWASSISASSAALKLVKPMKNWQHGNRQTTIGFGFYLPSSWRIERRNSAHINAH